jgi:hypothetical protein
LNSDWKDAFKQRMVREQTLKRSTPPTETLEYHTKVLLTTNNRSSLIETLGKLEQMFHEDPNNWILFAALGGGDTLVTLLSKFKHDKEVISEIYLCIRKGGIKIFLSLSLSSHF